MSLIHNWRRLFPGLLALLFLLFPAAALAADILPVDQVKSGMHGIGKTVVSGNKIEEFGVEVLGVMKDKGPSGDLILVRVYGDLIDKAGGIAQGMSGSPVYVEGKLVGAIAYGWSLTDHKVGMVTPIADMLKIWDIPGPATINPVLEDKPLLENDLETPRVEELQPVATPVMAAGFSANALAMLTEKLKPFQLVPYAIGVSGEEVPSEPLQPGSAVGVELVRGDVSLGALGTVTHVDNGKVLAFGHPFLKKGNVNFFMTNAHVFTVINSLENSFKVGATGDAIGMINQDRGAGIGGIEAKYPTIIPMRITVLDNSTGASRDAAVQVVYDEQLSPVLAATTVFNIIDKTLDRAGSGTARVSFEVSGRHMPVETIKRDNMFYTPGSIGELAVAELHEILAMLTDNQYNAVDIMDVKVNVSVDSERRTAAITEARTSVAQARPGEAVDIIVKLKPFRGEIITRTVTYTIPKNQTAGPMTLEVRGGGYAPLLYGILQVPGLGSEFKQSTKKQRTFADVINEFVDRDRNHELVVEVLDMSFDELAGGMPTGPQLKNKPSALTLQPQFPKFAKMGRKDTLAAKDGENKSKFTTTTDYIVEGDTQVMVQIVVDEKK